MLKNSQFKNFNLSQMKQTLLFLCLATSLSSLAQEHFSGISTSKRVGILNASNNPAELSNLKSKYEVGILSTSFALSNNQLTFDQLINGDDLENQLFKGDKNIDLRFDSEIHGPSFAIKLEKWAFAFTTKAHAKINADDINPTLGEAVTNGELNSILGSAFVQNYGNQRMNGTTWGEIGFGASREIFENENHKFSAGVTLKLLFPGSYANLGIDQFSGTFTNTLGEIGLTDAQGNINIAYSGKLAENFTDSGNYTKSIFGNLNGVAADFGVNYQLKNETGGYKVNAGLAMKNIGNMTFKSDNNSSTNYVLDIPAGQSLDLNQFENVESLEEIEDILLASGYLSGGQSNKDIKVKLPSTFVAYADVNVISDFYVTVFTQQKLNKDTDNKQITTQNVFSVTPRYSLNSFEVYAPLASNEISGFTAGLGFRVGGFFIGSSSAFTSLIGDGEQADLYLGFRIGLR